MSTFISAGAELLRVGGVLTYISSNKFLRAGYGQETPAAPDG